MVSSTHTKLLRPTLTATLVATNKCSNKQVLEHVGHVGHEVSDSLKRTPQTVRVRTMR